MNLSIFEKAGIEVTQQGKVSDVFKATGLDWEIEQKPIYIENGNDPSMYYGTFCYNPLPRLVGNFRSDNNNFLGIVSSKMYKPVQNIEAFNFIDELPNFTFEKVGMFDGGKKVFVVGKSNEQIDIDGSGDLIDFYLTFLHGHDGKSGIRFILCPIRMFCMNQMNLMLEKATFKHTIKHTGDIESKLTYIQRAIMDSRNYVINLENEIKELVNTKSTLTINTFVNQLIEAEDNDSDLVISRKEESRHKIINLYHNKDDLQNYKGTSFGMISAVSDFISHKEAKRKDASIDNAFIKNIEGNTLLNKARNLLQLVA